MAAGVEYFLFPAGVSSRRCVGYWEIGIFKFTRFRDWNFRGFSCGVLFWGWPPVNVVLGGWDLILRIWGGK